MVVSRIAIAFMLASQIIGVGNRKVSSTGSGTQIFCDAIPYSNGELSSVSGGNWAQGTSANIHVNSNTMISFQSDNYATYKWTGAGSFTADQYATTTFSTVNNDLLGPAVRANTTGTFYGVQCNNQGCLMAKVVSGTQTNLTAILPPVPTSGQVVELDVTGTGTATVTFKINGTTIATETDSTPIASGVPGVADYGGHNDTAVSRVCGGNLP